MKRLALVLATLALVACGKSDPKQKPGPVGLQPGSGSGSAKLPPSKSRIEQVAPPLDIKTPPADAVKTSTGLIYKKLVTNETGAQPKRNDTVVVEFTGWNQRSGETFNTTKGRNQPAAMPLNQAAPGFVEGLQLMRIGERAMLWIPPAMGYVRPPTGTPETLVYEVELREIVPAPPVPADVATPPETAIVLPSGTKYVVLAPGESTKPGGLLRSFDTATYSATSWDAEGRMIETTAKRPITTPVYKGTAALEEILEKTGKGTRIKFWVTADKMQLMGKAAGNPSGILCYEVEVTGVQRGNEPPSVPADVAKMPADVKKSPKGVGYRMLKPSPQKDAKHPLPTDRVRVNYTGWTTNGRMFESSIVRNEPGEFSLNGGTMGGWTEGVPMIAVGEKARLWIPEELAYKGSPGRPQGMLVFDIEVLEIKPPAAPKSHP